MRETKFIIVGGGLAGALTACYLGKAEYAVEVYEMRGDLRLQEVGGGKSINLALSYRGLCALEPVGLKDEILKMAVPMRGRMIHSPAGELAFQHYGVDDSQAINSVSRGGLNAALLTAAERYPSVKLFFQHKCTDVHLDSAEAEFIDTKTGQIKRVAGDVIISADGAFSAVRKAMQRQERFNYSQSYLEHGYKELHIPPGPGSTPQRPVFQLEKNALHIWPRKSFMMIALPNADGSFTCTLFWPFEGESSFAAIKDGRDLLTFFNREFPDAVPLMPTLAEDYFANPTGSLVTIRCSPWHVGGRVLLLGDAAHAVVPFYGQGMNAAFEDVMVLDECIREAVADYGGASSSPLAKSEIRRGGGGLRGVDSGGPSIGMTLGPDAAMRTNGAGRSKSPHPNPLPPRPTFGPRGEGAGGPSGNLPAAAGSEGGVTRMEREKGSTGHTQPAHASDTKWQGVFERFEALRKPNADALADLAIGNFLEMRDKTGSKLFLLKKKGEKLLAKLLPGVYLPLYGMVTFSRIPYAEAVARDRRQKKILGIVAAIVFVVAMIGIFAIAF